MFRDIYTEPALPVAKWPLYHSQGLVFAFFSSITSPRRFFSSQTQKQNNAFVSLCLAFSMEKFPVKLYVYDISRGLARQLSPLLLGKFARWIVREKIVYMWFSTRL